MKRLSLALLAAVALIATPQMAQAAYANSVTFTGQGFIADGLGGYDLQKELCAVLDANGNIIPDAFGETADAKGPYLLWVLTATKSSAAEITGPWGTAQMTKFGNGTFKYISGWYDPDSLVSFPVSATYNGTAKNAQLVVSHGCRPFQDKGAWCSPGFWKNAQDAAWLLTGKAKTDPFNGNVTPYFYGATFGSNPTLYNVLSFTGPGNPYNGAPVPGTSGYPLNAFNATGAFLTEQLPGYTFSVTLYPSEACPIDHDGNWKTTP